MVMPCVSIAVRASDDMRSPLQLARRSSLRFLAYRVLQQVWRTLKNLIFSIAWRGSLGACGRGTVIDAAVTLVLPKNIRIGSRCYVAAQCQLTTEFDSGTLEIGDDATIGPDARIDYTGGVKIGNEALISEGVRIYTHDHDTGTFKRIHATPLSIGDHVWLGARAVVLSSVTIIGEGAVVGAASVVTKNVAPGTVVAGNPARPVSRVGANSVSNQ
jgi:acetyltransferase-like isoleucine patch superfamily enzyme